MKAELFESIPPFETDPAWVLDEDAQRRLLAEADIPRDCTLATLSERMRTPDQVVELAPFADALSNLQIGLVRTPSLQYFGYCYTHSEHELLEDLGVGCLVALNPLYKPDGPSLGDIFLHEVTHCVVGEGHGWQFLCALNVIRLYCSLPTSTDLFNVLDGFHPYEFENQLDNRQATALNWGAQVASSIFAHMREEGYAQLSYQSLLGHIWGVDIQLRKHETEIRNRDDLFRLVPGSTSSM